LAWKNISGPRHGDRALLDRSRRPPHEFIALVGPRWVRQITILNLIAGLMRPTAGRVLYDGQEVTGPTGAWLHDAEGHAAAVANHQRQFRIALELNSHAVPRAEADDRVRQIIEQVGLKDSRNHTPPSFQAAAQACPRWAHADL